MTRKSVVGALLSALVAALAVVLAPTAHATGTGSITGSVTVPAGYDVRAVRVAASPTGADASPLGSPGAWVQPDGTFTITGLTAGTYNVSFGTYWSDMNPCSVNRDRWWTSPGVATGTCQGGAGVPTGAGTVTVSDGAATALGSTPLLTTFPLYHHTGKVLAPPGHTVAGVQVELWASDDGAWTIPGGWYRLTSVPVQTLTADGTFDFPLIDGPWSHGFALRFVDQPANGYAFSFSTGGHSSTETGQGGAAFGAGSFGVLAIPSWAYADVDLGTQQAKYEIGYSSGGVTITGTPEWGRTLTAHSTVVWSDPSVGTSYQWFRNGQAVDGATGPTFAMETMDDGWDGTMSVQARPAGAWAYNGSPIQTPELTITNTTPFSSTAPKIAGTAQVGKVLAASTGLWHPTAPTYTYAYRWFRGSSPIAGATKSTYVVAPADLGSKLHVEVSASRPPSCPTCAAWFTGPGTATSAALSPTKAGVIATSWITSWPTRVAAAKVGKRAGIHPFKLSATGKTQKLRATYQWYVGGKAVRGATGTSFLVKRPYKNKAVVLKVTLHKAGYAVRSRNVSFGKAR